jgi:hypothetical protein
MRSSPIAVEVISLTVGFMVKALIKREKKIRLQAVMIVRVNRNLCKNALFINKWLP